MIKLLLITSILLVQNSAHSDVCLNGVSGVDAEFVDTVMTIADNLKEQFKRRPVNKPKYHSLINIEANFSAPFIGKNKYFGRIYAVDGQPGIVKYRDEIIAQKRYGEESADPSVFYFSEYKVSDINSPAGMSIIKQAGAEVTLKSTNFSTTKGGRIFLKVKGPGDSPQNLVIDIKITPSGIQNYLVTNGQSIPFDSMKINAENSFIAGTSILNGIQNIEFSQNGNIKHTVNN